MLQPAKINILATIKCAYRTETRARKYQEVQCAKESVVYSWSVRAGQANISQTNRMNASYKEIRKNWRSKPNLACGLLDAYDNERMGIRDSDVFDPE